MRAAAAVLALQVAAVLVTARALVRAMSSNADAAAPLVMGERAAQYPDSLLVTGNYAWFNGLWSTQALSRLPDSQTLANYLPLLLTLTVTGALVAVAWRLLHPLGGVLLGVVVLAAGTEGLLSFGAWSFRAPTWWTMALVALLVTWVAHGPRRPWAWVAAAVPVAVLAGATLAGDALAWATVMAPLGAAAVALAAGRAWRRAGALLGLGVVIVGLRFAIGALATDAGYRYTGAPTPVAPVEAVDATTANLVLGLQVLWQGGGPEWLNTVRGLVGALLLAAGVAGAVAALVGGDRRRQPADRAPARRAWTAFWLTVVLASAGAFAITTVSGPLGAPVVRYLVALPFATGALLAVLATAGRRARIAVAVPALALGLVAAGTLAADPPAETAQLHRPAISRITAAVERYDLDVGYASYWSAYPIERATAGAYEVLPAGPCRPGGAELCRPFLHYVSGAYAERPGARSFLLVDRSPTALAGDPLTFVTAEPAGVTPERTVDVGDGLTLLVYPFDLARVLADPGAPLR